MVLCALLHVTAVAQWVQACSAVVTAFINTVLLCVVCMCDFSNHIFLFLFLSLSHNLLSVTGIYSLLKAVNTCQRVVEVEVRCVSLEESCLRFIPKVGY